MNNISIMKIFGERLKELRVSKKMSQAQLAHILNVSGNTICSWEKDKQEPSLETLVRLSEIMEVSVDYLVGKINY